VRCERPYRRHVRGRHCGRLCLPPALTRRGRERWVGNGSSRRGRPRVTQPHPEQSDILYSSDTVEMDRSSIPRGPKTGLRGHPRVFARHKTKANR
jgi:hypothetical protein